MSAAAMRQVLAVVVAVLAVAVIGGACAVHQQAQRPAVVATLDDAATPSTTAGDPWASWCDPAYYPEPADTAEVCGEPGPGPYNAEGATCPYVVGYLPESWHYDCTNGTRPAAELELLAVAYHRERNER